MIEILASLAILLSQLNTALAQYEKPEPPAIVATITGYSSTEDQTDSTPFEMASGKRVYRGAIANNCYPFGTKVIIKQELYTLEDRMNKRYGCDRWDIWFPSREEALEWGIKKDVQIKILDL